MDWMVRGSNPGGGRDLPHPSRRPLWPTHSLYSGYRVSFPGIKWPGRGVDHPMIAKVIGWTLPLLQYGKDRKGSGCDVIQRYPGANLVDWFLYYLTNLFQNKKWFSCQLRWNKTLSGEYVSICKDTINNTCFFFCICLKKWGKQWRTFIIATGLRVQVRTRNFPNMSWTLAY